MKKLGILGGLGPMATAYFLQLLTQMTDAQTDQEHMEILLYSKPSIPDRTSYIIGKSNANPADDMVAAGRTLKEMGADLIAIPCITAHFFHRELEERIGLPILHAIKETALYLDKEYTPKAASRPSEEDPIETNSCLPEGIAAGTSTRHGTKHGTKVGILATDGTIQSGLFQDTLRQHGIQPLLPGAESQKKLMDIIYNELKTGRGVTMPRFHRIAQELSGQGAEVILLACTELSLLKRDYGLPARYLDVLEILARKAVQSCSRLKEGYIHLCCQTGR